MKVNNRIERFFKLKDGCYLSGCIIESFPSGYNIELTKPYKDKNQKLHLDGEVIYVASTNLKYMNPSFKEKALML